MKLIKILTLIGTILVSGCAALPADLAKVELDTINKKLVVVGNETRAIFKTANELYAAGMLPYGSELYNSVDKLITNIKKAYDELSAIRELAKYEAKEKDYKVLIMSLRDLLYSIKKHYGSNNERTENIRYVNWGLDSEREHRGRVYYSTEACQTCH